MSSLRRNIMLGTAGHVDHGKSALVKLLTGCETDTLAEEKQRGLTIDLGFAPCRLADERIVGVVDVPGHVDFIRNMVAGAHGIDVVIFVVAADDGIMPQTHEHLHILGLMGLRHGVVALTKIDLVDAARLEFVTNELRRLLASTFLASAAICPICNHTGQGFEGFFDSLNQAVEACGERRCGGWFRLWVEDAFAIRGAGAVVTGIPTHGRVGAGSRLQLWPAGLSGHVRRLQVYGEDAAEGRAGECVALNIPELDHQAVHRGMVLCEPDTMEPSSMAEADLRILPSVKGKVKDYMEVQLHVGTASVAAHIAMLESAEMSGGQEQLVQLRLAVPLPLVPGERFVVRANLADAGAEGLSTIGGGQILGLTRQRLRRKKQWTIDLLTARRQAVTDPLSWCEQMVRESDVPSTVATLAQKCWSKPEELAPALERLRADNRVVERPGSGWLHREVIQKTAEQLLATVRSLHLAHPQRAGFSRLELAAALKTNTVLLDAAAESLVQSKQLEARDKLLAQTGWQARVADQDQRLCEQLAARLQQAGWSPPGLEELAGGLHEPVARVASAARLLAEQGTVVPLNERTWMHREAIETGKQAALTLFRRAPSFSTMDFRDALGVSRKYAVPLVDYLDKIRFTVRCGNNRTPGVEAKKFLK